MYLIINLLEEQLILVFANLNPYHPKSKKWQEQHIHNVILEIGCALSRCCYGQRTPLSDNFSEKNFINQRKKLPYRLSSQAIGDYIEFSMNRLRTLNSH